MSSKSLPESLKRLNTLRDLLMLGEMSTQEDLVAELKRQKLTVTQSTISRDLRRLGAIKTVDGSGRTIYRLPDDSIAPVPLASSSLRNLLVDINHNGHMIVIHTSPGSASLVARQLDQNLPSDILGTLAGDDTVFVAPAQVKKINETLELIVQQLT